MFRYISYKIGFHDYVQHFIDKTYFLSNLFRQIYLMGTSLCFLFCKSLVAIFLIDTKYLLISGHYNQTHEILICYLKTNSKYFLAAKTTYLSLSIIKNVII